MLLRWIQPVMYGVFLFNAFWRSIRRISGGIIKSCGPVDSTKVVYLVMSDYMLDKHIFLLDTATSCADCSDLQWVADLINSNLHWYFGEDYARYKFNVYKWHDVYYESLDDMIKLASIDELFLPRHLKIMIKLAMKTHCPKRYIPT